MVVIAVIVILASMLLPSLSRARGAARRVTCAGNLKQLGPANLIYAGDNHDCLAPYTESSGMGGAGKYRLGQGLSDGAIDLTGDGRLGDYYEKTVTVTLCPGMESDGEITLSPVRGGRRRFRGRPVMRRSGRKFSRTPGFSASATAISGAASWAWCRPAPAGTITAEAPAAPSEPFFLFNDRPYDRASPGIRPAAATDFPICDRRDAIARREQFREIIGIAESALERDFRNPCRTVL